MNVGNIMKIPRQMHQFADEHTFIIVAGKQEALMYHAHDGEISLVDSVKIPRPHYSDNEGLSKARSHNGGSIRSSTFKEIRDQEIISDFIRELKKHMEKVRAEMYSEVVVVASPKTKNEIAQALPDRLKRKVTSIIEGQYYRESPIRIIEKTF
jgi:protein required for attachment to host cells